MALKRNKLAKQRIKEYKTKTAYRNLGITKALNLDAQKLSTSEMRDYYNSLIKLANKRIEKLKSDKWGKVSPAYNDHKRGFKPIKEPKIHRNIDTYRNRLYHETAKLKDFLSSETSTLKGTKSFIKDSIRNINEQTGGDFKFTPRQFKRFWDLWTKARDIFGGGDVKGNKGDSPIWKKLAELVTSRKWKSTDEILDAMEDTINKEYERAEQQEQDENVTDVFEVPF